MPLKLGSRLFEPRLFTTLLTIVLIGALISLGRWQLSRADEKRALYELFASGADGSRVIDRATPPLPRYQHVQASGGYDSSRQILIDNMSNAESHAGYYVITPFALEGGGWILVNRGWVPVGASRAKKPQIAVPSEVREVHGRTDRLPRAGLRLEGAALAAPYPVVANYPTQAELGSLLHENDWAPAAEVVLLDARDPDGYLRQWQPPGFPPMRHVAYAVQWFGLALALAVIYVVTNLRRAEPADPDRRRGDVMSEQGGALHVRRQRRVLIGLALLFFAPLALAFVLYYGLGWRPGGRVNHGDLIDPPRPLTAPAMPRVAAGGAQADGLTGPDLFTHKWTLLYWGAGTCPARCRASLYNTRQVRIALGRDMDRVQRVFIADGPCCDMDFIRAQNRDLITVRSTPEAASLLGQLRNGDDTGTADRVYLIDPLGNLMMSYAPEAKPKGMLQDLKRLLGLSSVG